MVYDFDQYIDRHNTNSIKWDKYPNGVIPLWIADSDFRVPDCITSSLKKRIEHGIFGYGSIPKELIDVFINRLKILYNWKVKSDWVIILPGVVSGLNICVRAFTKKTQSIMIPNPIYPPFRQAAIFNNRNEVNIPLILKNKRWVLNLEYSTKKLKGNEKLLVLCNPQNPGGTVYTKKELEKQLFFAKTNNLIVCSDEVHCDIILEPKCHHIPFANLNEDAQNRTITLMSPSKTFNIAGLGIAVAIIANSKLRERFQKISRGILPSVNILALVAAISAWKDGNKWLEYQIKYLRKNRDFLVSQINKIDELSMVSPEGTYLGWINTKKLNIKNPSCFFQKYGIGLSSGKDFGNNLFVRLNFSCTYSLLKEAIKRIKNAIINYR